MFMQGTLKELQLPNNVYVGGFKDRADVTPAAGIDAKLTGVIQRVGSRG